MSLFELLVCYGLTFGLMNKTSWIQNRLQFTKSLLECSYCTGFHSGWIIYLLMNFNHFNYENLIMWSFASSAFCYCLDTVIAYYED